MSARSGAAAAEKPKRGRPPKSTNANLTPAASGQPSASGNTPANPKKKRQRADVFPQLQTSVPPTAPPTHVAAVPFPQLPDESNPEATAPSSSKRVSVGSLHASGAYTLLSRDVHSNSKWQCAHGDCDQVLDGRNLDVLHDHALSHSEGWGRAFRKRYVQKHPGHRYSRYAADREGPVVDPILHARERLAMLQIVKGLSFSLVEDQYFRDFVFAVMDLVAPDASTTVDWLPSRKTIVDELIEGENGLFERFVKSAYERMLPVCQYHGAQLMFDGATDSCHTSVEVFMLQSGASKMWLTSLTAGAQQKTADWMRRAIAAVLEGAIDLSVMRLRDAATAPSSPAASANPAASQDKMEALFGKLFTLCPFVCAGGGDNANTPVCGMYMIQESHGLIPFGCVAHATDAALRALAKLFKSAVIDPVTNLTDVILSHQVLNSMAKARSIMLKRFIPTRFGTMALVCETVIKYEAELKELMDLGGAFQKHSFGLPLTSALRKDMTEAVRAVQDPAFWKWTKFFVKLTIGFIVAIRCFDGCLTGSVCFVYQFWRNLANTVRHVFVTEDDKSMASPELLASCLQALGKKFNRFHFPVYSAGYLLNVHTKNEARMLQLENVAVWRQLKMDTIDCCVLIMRRFDERGAPRPVPLPSNDPLLEAYRERLDEELIIWITSNTSARVTVAPSLYWLETELSLDLLRVCAIKICCISPSTGVVERGHKISKGTRTKQRGCLKYARAHGLNFVCAEEKVENHGCTTLDWKVLMGYGKRFDELAPIDYNFMLAAFDFEGEEEHAPEEVSVNAAAAEEEMAEDQDQMEEDEEGDDSNGNLPQNLVLSRNNATAGIF